MFGRALGLGLALNHCGLAVSFDRLDAPDRDADRVEELFTLADGEVETAALQRVERCVDGPAEGRRLDLVAAGDLRLGGMFSRRFGIEHDLVPSVRIKGETIVRVKERG